MAYVTGVVTKTYSVIVEREESMAEEQANVAELQQEEVVQPKEEASQAEATELTSRVSETPPPSDKDYNFKRLREEKERIDQELAETRKRLREFEQLDPDNIDDSDLAEGRHVKSLQRRVESQAKELKKFQDSYHQQMMTSQIETFRSKNPDFDQVVTKENIEKLKTTEPEVFASITVGEDLYAKSVSAYKTLKALGIADPYKDQKDQVQVNQSRPLSAQAVKGQGALSDANAFAKGLTPELKKQLQHEMVEAIKAR